MNEKFFALPREKQDRMINAAIKIFALKGYDKAGTDSMIKEAGISKGLLFHYFGSKINLYAFVTEYCTRYLMMELAGCVDAGEKNIFERIRIVEESKLRMLDFYPYLDLFLISLMGEDDETAKECSVQWVKKVEETYKGLIEDGADENLLKDGLDKARARELTELSMEGYKLRSYGAGATPKEMVNGYLPYLNILKEALSK